MPTGRRHFASRRRRRLSPPRPRANMSLDARSSFIFKAKLAEQAERHDGASAIRVTQSFAVGAGFDSRRWFSPFARVQRGRGRCVTRASRCTRYDRSTRARSRANASGDARFWRNARATDADRRPIGSRRSSNRGSVRRCARARGACAVRCGVARVRRVRRARACDGLCD